MGLLIIKIMKGTSIETNLRNAYKNKGYYIYNTTDRNKNRYTEIHTELKNTFSFLNTIFIIHKNNEPQDAYICKSQKIESNSNILCKDLSFTSNHLAINKLINNSHIDLKKDFESGIYIF